LSQKLTSNGCTNNITQTSYVQSTVHIHSLAFGKSTRIIVAADSPLSTHTNLFV